MRTQMKWLPVVASLWFGCLPASSAGAHGAASVARSGHRARQSGSASHPTPTAAKKSSKKHRHQTKRETFQKAPTPERISEIQSALTRAGYYQGDSSGKWDSNTIAAVEKFQSANGIDPSGKLDAPTLQKLGLGSDIAGVSAPRVVAPPLANLSPPTTPVSTSKSPSSSSSSATSR